MGGVALAKKLGAPEGIDGRIVQKLKLPGGKCPRAKGHARPRSQTKPDAVEAVSDR